MSGRCSRWSIAPICWRSGASRPRAAPSSSPRATRSARRTWDCSMIDAVFALFTRMDCAPDIFFLEAICNGLLLAGLLALLALGLNLIFGVIDVVWICYAEIVMFGMYGINFAFKAGMPFPLAAGLGILLTTAVGALLHFLVIRPVLESAPINQLLVTGGVLIFLQAAATMAF